MENIIVELITASALIVVALIQARQGRAAKDEAEKSEAFRQSQAEEEQRREERDAALYALVFANASGTEVLLHKAHGDEINGNVDAALKDIRSAKADLNEISLETMARM